MLREAVDLFLEEARKMKTLDTILGEAGYTKINKEWSAPQIIEIAQE